MNLRNLPLFLFSLLLIYLSVLRFPSEDTKTTTTTTNLSIKPQQQQQQQQGERETRATTTMALSASSSSAAFASAKIVPSLSSDLKGTIFSYAILCFFDAHFGLFII